MRGGGSYHDNSHCFHCSFVVLDHWSMESSICFDDGHIINLLRGTQNFSKFYKTLILFHFLQDPWNVSSWSPIVGGDKLQGTRVMVAMKQGPVLASRHTLHTSSQWITSSASFYLQPPLCPSWVMAAPPLTSTGSCPGQVDQDITCTLLPMFTPCLA